MNTSPRHHVVLCIEDEQVMLCLLQSGLAADGHLVLTAANGLEALRLAASCRVDAVVLDYSMQGANGAEIACQIKSLQPNTAIIMYSGSPDLRSLTPNHVDAFVEKSEGVHALVSVLQRLVQPHQGSLTAVRKFRRYGVELPFSVVVDRAGELTLLKGVSIALSEGGIGGKVQGSLVPGEVVLIQIADSQLGISLEPRAQVRFREKDVYGFEFLDVTPPQQEDLRRFCQRLAFASTFFDENIEAHKWAQ